MNRVVPHIIVVAILAAHAAGQTPPDYGYSWSTITHAGNRPANEQEAENLYPPNTPAPFLVGAVAHEYRMATTEVTTTQWLEFARAYAPYNTGALNDPGFTSKWAQYAGNGQFAIYPGSEQWPAEVSWRMAARYCNWLSNGKANQASAFESGAYDTTTFAPIDPGSPFTADQAAHSPGAKFWLPTLDEWIKATYYDPNRYGPGHEGYWPYPNASLIPLISGLPANGGQTNAGLRLDQIEDFPVGMYPDISGPWGLLDTSGTSQEWTETIQNPLSRTRYVAGSADFVLNWAVWDRLDVLDGASPHYGLVGLRLASAVPGPAAGSSLLLLSSVLSTRRTRNLNSARTSGTRIES